MPWCGTCCRRCSDNTNRRVPLLRGRYSASLLIRTHPPPSRRRSISRLSRLYDLPCSGDFAPGRGGLLQLLGMSLLPCCRFHPAEVSVPYRSDFGISCCLRPMEAGSAFGSTPFRGRLRVHFCCRFRSRTPGPPSSPTTRSMIGVRTNLPRLLAQSPIGECPFQ